MLDNTIYEYQQIKSEKLKVHIQNTAKLQEYFKADFSCIKARHYCGIINYADENYFILPKITNDNNDKSNLDIFVYMLIYSHDINMSTRCEHELWSGNPLVWR